jgi:hypothetical protein
MNCRGGVLICGKIWGMVTACPFPDSCAGQQFNPIAAAIGGSFEQESAF